MLYAKILKHCFIDTLDREVLMTWFYNLIYLALLAIVSPVLLWRTLRSGKYRQGFWEKCCGYVPRRTSQNPCIWLHAVSVGEVNLIQTLITELEQQYPTYDFVISTTTHTGYELARKKYAPRQVFYAPLDFSWAVKNALRRIRPQLLILAELEVWPNLIHLAKQAKVQVAVVNGRLSDKSFRGYSRVAWLLRPMFSQLDLVAAQTAEYAERFIALGTEHTHITGSLKFDGALQERQNPQTLRLATLAGITKNNVIFLAGSTQAPEETTALQAWEAASKQYAALKLIMVPRHPERFDEVAHLLNQSGHAWIRRSQLVPNEPVPEWKILLVDAVGELGAWWGTAHMAFVGGSLGNRGGQNMIEPAAYGAAVCFGPNTWNFRDVVSRFLQAKAAVVIHNAEELQTFLQHCLEDASFTATLGTNAKNLVASNQGATQHTMELLESLLLETPINNRIKLKRAS
jgi:3-deoxy-D-manno-octulosonic-acid transferase